MKTSFHLIDEMRQAPDLIRRFDPAVVADWQQRLAGCSRWLLTGEGSSRIFPAGNLMATAREQGVAFQMDCLGAREAMEGHFDSHAVIACSNSGRTREVIAFLEKTSLHKLPRFAVTATAASPMTTMVDDHRVLSCGEEKAVAASKSVIEQALYMQALLPDFPRQTQALAADAAARILSTSPDKAITEALATAEHVHFCGRTDGVAAELALKTVEITRQKSGFLDGTLILHGIEEVLSAQDCVVLVDPFVAEIEKYKSVLQPTGARVIAISPSQTPFATIEAPVVSGFTRYVQLMAGWSLLTAAGIMRGIDIDKPLRARKVGNAV